MGHTEDKAGFTRQSGMLEMGDEGPNNEIDEKLAMEA